MSSAQGHLREAGLERREFIKLTGSAAVMGALGYDLAGATTGGSPGPSGDLCFASAAELAAGIRSRRFSAREVMTAHLRQIGRLNPRLNAIVAKRDDAACLSLADAADASVARGDSVGPLHGLPIAIKDNEPVIGFPFTRGSPIFRHEFPTAESVVVTRLRRAGCLIIGKTNMAEFAMGSHTYNQVYGTTVNPYDLTKSAGGSSGGAAAALAAGLIPIADGSDLAGSLRNPGNFNNVVGLRPSIGLVPGTPAPIPFGNLAVKGPLARSVTDVALLLGVLAGPDAGDPASYPADPSRFAQPLRRDFRGVRVGWSPDLGGLPMEPAVRDALAPQREVFERLGCIVEEAHPDLTGAEEAFLALRSWRSWATYGALLPKHRAEMKPEAIGEIEAGAALTVAQLTEAMRTQARVMEAMRRFQEKHEFFVCAVNQVTPFDAALNWPKEIAGVKMEHYIAWMKSAYWISTTGSPAISVPAAFTPGGLPVGIHLVGRYRADFGLLQFAYAFEQATQIGLRRPKLAAAI
jgi:amidase